MSSYSFYKPVLSSLVTSFKDGGHKTVQNGGDGEQFHQVDCFNKNIFLNGEKYVLDTKFKAKNSFSSIGYDQIFGLENKIKIPEEGKALKKAKAIASGVEQKTKKRNKSKKRPGGKRSTPEISKNEHIYNIIVENRKYENKLKNETSFIQPKFNTSRKSAATKPFESLPDFTLLPKKFKSSGHLCQDIYKLKR